MKAPALTPIEELAAVVRDRTFGIADLAPPTPLLATAARHSSVSNEHYTPAAVVEAARVTLDGIDLDPASCTFANETVKAARIHTKEDSGFDVPWSGRVFLNPPGGRDPGAKAWWFKLAAEWASGRVPSAIFVGFTVEILQTTQVGTPDGAAIPLDFALCFPARRVAYDREVDGARTRGGSPPHASVIVCVSDDPEVVARFCRWFRPIGRVVGEWRVRS